MIVYIAVLAAFGCAVCNGAAAILQKVGADKETTATSLRVGFLWKLLHGWPFLAGTALDGLAWILTLVAVHSLPLFVVQPIIAFSVGMTVVLERFVFGKKIDPKVVFAILFMIYGLTLLTTTASAETAVKISRNVQIIVVFSPLLLAAIGSFFARRKDRFATVALAATSGIAFGGTAIVGRALVFSSPYWRVFVSPLFVALLAYGVVGILLFAIALQRQYASVVNAAMITFETLVPICFGLLFFGDSPRHNLWPVMLIGACSSLAGALFIALKRQDQPKVAKSI